MVDPNLLSPFVGLLVAFAKRAKRRLRNRCALRETPRCHEPLDGTEMTIESHSILDIFATRLDILDMAFLDMTCSPYP